MVALRRQPLDRFSFPHLLSDPTEDFMLLDSIQAKDLAKASAMPPVRALAKSKAMTDRQ